MTGQLGTLALACAGLGLITAPASWQPASLRRLRTLAPPQTRTADRRRRRMPPKSATFSCLIGLATAFVLGGPLGLVLGTGTALAAARFLRSRDVTTNRRDIEARQAELPIALDLIGECLAAGMPTAKSFEVVAQACPGPLAADLRRVAELCRLGVPTAAVWTELRSDPTLGAVARAVCRTSDSGAALAITLRRVSAQLRADSAAAAQAAARRAGVLVMAPLGLCFLPAFVAVGVVPVVIGIAQQVVV